MLKHWTAGIAVAVAAFGLAACGTATSAPAPTIPATSVPPTDVPATTVPSTNVPATSVPTAAVTTASAQTITLVIDSASTQARYHAREQLVGRSLPSEAVGTSKKVSGTIVLDSTGTPVHGESKITVDLTALQSDESRRDNFVKGQTLNTREFPTATFVARATQGLPSPLPTSGQATFELSGDLTVHGVTRPVTWQVNATFGDGTLNGTATTTVQISDFGMTPPKAGPVLGIEDQLTLELVFAANRQA